MKHPAWFPPIAEWSPDDPVTCRRCGQTLRSGDTELDVGCIAKTRKLCKKPKQVFR